MISATGDDMVPQRPDRAIHEQITAIEEAAEQRWMAEFARYRDEQDNRVAALREQYDIFRSFVATLMEMTGKPLSYLSLNADSEKGREELQERLKQEVDEAYSIMHMGSHSKHLLEEVKRQEGLHAHWEEFCMLLRLSEDDDTEKYHRF